MGRRFPGPRSVGRRSNVRRSPRTGDKYRGGFPSVLLPKIGHLIAHECGDFQIIHHVHQDGNDDIDDDDEADIWAIIGAGSTAATVVLSTTGTYDQQTGFSCLRVVANGPMDRDRGRRAHTP